MTIPAQETLLRTCSSPPRLEPCSFPNDDRSSPHLFRFSSGNNFDLGLYRRGTRQVVHVPPRRARSTSIATSIRRMSSVIYVMSSPYFAFTRASGNVSLSDVTPGSYTLVSWNEQGGMSQSKLELPGGWSGHCRASRSTSSVYRATTASQQQRTTHMQQPPRITEWTAQTRDTVPRPTYSRYTAAAPEKPGNVERARFPLVWKLFLMTASLIAIVRRRRRRHHHDPASERHRAHGTVNNSNLQRREGFSKTSSASASDGSRLAAQIVGGDSNFINYTNSRIHSDGRSGAARPAPAPGAPATIRGLRPPISPSHLDQLTNAASTSAAIC